MSTIFGKKLQKPNKLWIYHLSPPFVRSTTSLGASPHHWCKASHHLCKASHHLHEVQHRFVSAWLNNDVVATLIMMLTFGQTMLCPADTNEKRTKRLLRSFLAPTARARTDDSCIPQSGILPGEEMFAYPCAKSRKIAKLTPSGKLTVSLRSKRWVLSWCRWNVRATMSLGIRKSSP